MYVAYFVAVIAAAAAVGIGRIPRRIRLALAIGLLLSASVRYVLDPSILGVLVVLVWAWWTFHAFFEPPAKTKIKENL